MKQMVSWIARQSARHPWQVLVLTLVISLFSVYCATRLPVYTSRQALLPQDTDVARRLNSFLEKFGSASDLIVAIEGAERPELEQFATELAQRLNHQPEIAHATERLDRSFFIQHAYLLIPQAQLTQLETLLTAGEASKPPETLASALRQARNLLASPLPATVVDLSQATKMLTATQAFLEEWQRWLGNPSADHLDWGKLLAAAGAQELANGYFASHNGQLLFVFVHATNPSEDFSSLEPFNQRVQAEIDALSREWRSAGRQTPIGVLTGLPAIEYEEYLDIDKDIRLVIFTAIALIAILILAVVRSIRWALAIFIPMGLGALWSLALAWGTVGHLTIITSSFLAILFGLGADYGIFTTSQIAESRRAGKPLIDAIGDGIALSYPAVMTAGGASLLIFGSLATVKFPGFAELGLVAAGGVLLILTSTWFVQPAIYALLPPLLADTKQADARKANDQAQGGRFPGSVAILLVAVATITAILGLAAGIRIPFDYDVLSLLPADSRAAQYQRRMATETDYQSEVVIFTADNLDEIRRITDQASQLKTIARVQSITDLFPADADTRLQQAKQMADTVRQGTIARQLELLDRDGINTAEFQQITSLLEQAGERIDEAQEQAFSSGHSSLVKELESLRSRIDAILDRIHADPGLARQRSVQFLRALINQAKTGLDLIRGWQTATAITPAQLPESLKDRFVSADGTLAAYAFPAQSVYDPDNLDRLIADVYSVSPGATGFPTTHQVFSKAVVDSFTRGTLLALAACLIWLALVLRSVKAFVLASLPLLIGGGWMLGLMAVGGLRYNYANIIALPLVIALAVDYGVWFSHRWRELAGHPPLAITRDAGKVIALAAGTELAGLGAITLASYRGVSGLGVDITIGLLTCLAATLLVGPAIGQLIEAKRSK